jgi:hypothetical protein
MQSTSDPQQRGRLMYKLTDLIWHDRGEPGAWEAGVINPSQLELDRYSDAREQAREFAVCVIELFEREGWAPPR